VGPQGAGARPGPACYGAGGTEPTVTDALLVLGRLRPGPYAGGAVTLDAALARAAIERRVARPLGLDVEAAAVGIVRLLEQNLLHAVERVSIERGYDPRRFTLVAAGGAGPGHGAAVGRALGCPRVYVPRQAGAFCAIGMLHSELRQDHLEVWLAPLDGLDSTALEAGFAALERRAADALKSCRMDGIERRLDRELDLRYRGQIWSIRTALPRIAPDAVRPAFEAEHRRLYGHVQPEGAIEITALRVVGRGLFAPPPIAGPPPAEAPPEPVERRTAHLDERRGGGTVPVYAGAALRPGHRLEGPLLVEEETTTIFVGPEDTLEVDAAGDYLIHLPKGTGHDRA
jgi:N-methylhydantoinase A